MLSDPACLGNLPPNAEEMLFDPEYWRRRGELAEVSGGRGSAWFIASGARQWALRHFRRGGFIARLWQDSLCVGGRESSAGLRRVAAARAADRARLARAEAGCRPLSAQRPRLPLRFDHAADRECRAVERARSAAAGAACAEARWRAVGRRPSRGLHRAGVDHADLNAHNILIDAKGTVSIIDFDRGRMRGPGAWAARNLQRLRRSLRQDRALFRGIVGLADGGVRRGMMRLAVLAADLLRRAVRLRRGAVARPARSRLLAGVERALRRGPRARRRRRCGCTRSAWGK